MSIKYNILFINQNEKNEYIPKYLKKNYSDDVGLDLYIMKQITVPANSIGYKVPLGIKNNAFISDKLSSYMIFPRSSMGSKTPLRLSNSIGLVDPGYTGELIMCVDNISSNDFIIEKNSRLIQLVAPNHQTPSINFIDNLIDTKRNSNGFGSTGI